jgi:hypothetical protein
MGQSHKTLLLRLLMVMRFGITVLVAKFSVSDTQHKYWVSLCWVWFCETSHFPMFMLCWVLYAEWCYAEFHSWIVHILILSNLFYLHYWCFEIWYNSLNCQTQHKWHSVQAMSVIMLSFVMQNLTCSFCYAECLFVECYSAECCMLSDIILSVSEH